MAVKPANSKYHTFTFNGVRAADYGIYVTDVNVFNSAARDVEYIEIPGRDGAFALDRGRFQNISVVYKCAMTQDTDEDFATAISEFRNAIASTKGYKRLEDDIHTDEYRMGVFSKGLEAPTLNTKTATFDVEFNCQPQRFLKSGETAVSISSGGTITNPTPFDAHPLLQVWGYGEVGINGEKITINDGIIGDIILAKETAGNTTTFPEQYVNEYDFISMQSLTDTSMHNIHYTGYARYEITSVTGSKTSGDFFALTAEKGSDKTFVVDLSFIDIEGEYGVDETSTGRIKIDVSYTVNGTAYTDSIVYEVGVQYSGNQYTLSFTKVSGGAVLAYGGTAYRCGAIYAYSTKSLLGEPLYFDLEIGEAYKIENNKVVSINNAVTIPVHLPEFKSGSNVITYSNTVRQFKIVPRWWEV